MCYFYRTKDRKGVGRMMLLDLGILSFVVGTLLFTGIWYLKEQAELPTSPSPPQSPPKTTREKTELTCQ